MMGKKIEKLDGHEAVLLLQTEFAALAKRLKPRHFDMQENIAQEMSLSVVACKKPHTLNFFRNRARSRAKNFLRNWFRKTPVDRAIYKDRLGKRPDVFNTGIPSGKDRLAKLSVTSDMNVPSAEDLIETMKRSA